MAEKTIPFPQKPIDLIFDNYRVYLSNTIKFKDKSKETQEKTKNTYINCIKNAIRTTNGSGESVFETEAERDFLDILPDLIAKNNKSDIIRLIGLIRRSAWIHEWGTNKKSYSTYLETFVDYIYDLVNKKEYNGVLKKIRKELNNTVGNNGKEYSNILNDSFSEREIYFHDELEKNFCWRLGSQSRTSGDKIWLPLLFIKKIYEVAQRANANTDYEKWIKSSFNNIYVNYLYEDNNNNQIVGHKKLANGKVFLELENNDEGGKDVWIIVPGDRDKKYRYRVLTPTGNGNGKERLTVKEFKQIAIDHVKSIDQSLRELGDAQKLEMLTNVSEKYKSLTKTKKKKDIKSTDLEKAAKEFVDQLGDSKEEKMMELTKELKRIKNDGVLRLMKSEYNSQKNNNETFKKIYIRKDGEYIGILETDIKLGSNLKSNLKNISTNTDMTLYQILNNNFADSGLLYVDDNDALLKGLKEYTDKLDKIIDYI